MAVYSPIYPKGPNVSWGETPRVWLSEGEKMALDECLGSQALDLTTHGLCRHSIAGGYAMGPERRWLSGTQGTKKKGVNLGGTLSMQDSLKLSEGEGSYPSGEVEKTQSPILSGGKTCLGGGVSGESGSSGVVGPYPVLDSDDLFLI